MGLLLALTLWASCTKPTKLGGDLVEGEKSDIVFTDTLPLHITTVRAHDSLVAFAALTNGPAVAVNRHYVGIMNDPVFGTDTSEVIVVYGPAASENWSDKFIGSIVDSVKLNLILDSAGFFGDPTTPIDIGVYRLTQPMSPDTTYYTNQYFEAEDMPIGHLDGYLPDLNKRLLVVTPDLTDSAIVYAQISLPFGFGAEILGYDSLTFSDPDKYIQAFKGLKIRATSPANYSLALSLKHSFSEIDIYYHTPVEDSLVLRLFPAHGKYPSSQYYAKDYSGSEVANHIDVPDDSLLFVQSTDGLELKLELPKLDPDGGFVIINKAILELTCENLPMDDTVHFKVIPQFYLKDTADVEIADVREAIGTGLLQEVFGGYPVRVTRNGETRTVVRLNISHVMQDIQSGHVSGTLILQPADRVSRKGRTVFRGFSGDPVWQPKLYLSVTYGN